MLPTGIGKSEIDLYIKGKNGYELYIDIKNTKNRYGKKETDKWLKIAEYLRKDKTKALFLVYSENGYTKGTKERLEANGIHVIKDSEINDYNKGCKRKNLTFTTVFGWDVGSRVV